MRASTGLVGLGRAGPSVLKPNPANRVVPQDLRKTCYANGGFGNDYPEGGDGGDVLVGGFGNDVVAGNYGSDALYGGFGSDTLWADYDDDVYPGGRFGDRVFWA